eukprot:GHUV01026044.1.p1 GENE.GHUV01026044.1~~GHUV01026044.1.p1  ORF type:complete len:143 (+),score=21.72 GHUV01026044.1:169-597(+)
MTTSVPLGARASTQMLSMSPPTDCIQQWFNSRLQRLECSNGHTSTAIDTHNMYGMLKCDVGRCTVQTARNAASTLHNGQISIMARHAATTFQNSQACSTHHFATTETAAWGLSSATRSPDYRAIAGKLLSQSDYNGPTVCQP